MKLNKLFLSILGAILLFSGCNANDLPNGTQTEAVDSAVTDICLYENGTSLYTIIRPDVKSDAISQAVSLAWSTFSDTFGCDLNFSNDWVADPSEIPLDTAEILIGNTNRPESAELAATIDGLIYRVSVINNRIVIVASSDFMLYDAVQAFLNTVQVDEAGRVTVPGDLNLTCTAADGWHLPGVPSYDYGTITGYPVSSATGFAPADNPSLIYGINNTTADDFAAYIEKVKSEGFTVYERANWDSVSSYQCTKDDITFYTYHTHATNETRIILDHSISTPLEEYSYVYEPAEGETNDVYIYGIFTHDPTNAGTEIYPSNGQLLMVKLADNSLIVIDGGSGNQVDPDLFLQTIREITGTLESEKVRIACWFITHSHDDHYQGFRNFFLHKQNEIDIERILYNFKPGTGGDFDLTEYYPDILYHQPHTGETIALGGATLDILYTQEDALNLSDMVYIGTEQNTYNNSSTCLRINFDGKTCLILGDLDNEGSMVLLDYYTDAELKSNVLQIAHHGFNHMHSLYEKVQADIALYPTSYGTATEPNNLTVHTSVSTTCAELYYAGNETVGVRVIDGKVTAFYRSPTIYE